MTTPLSRAWSTLIRYPLLALIPVLWEAGVFLLNLSLGSLPQRGPGNTFSLKLLLPQSLPSGADLISQSVTLNVQSFVGEPLVPMLIGTILGAMVTAGYLHLLNRALLGAAPSWRAFTEGAARFGPRLLLWNLLSMVMLFIVFILSAAVRPGSDTHEKKACHTSVAGPFRAYAVMLSRPGAPASPAPRSSHRAPYASSA
ncbi:MAG: hypothetical protein JWN15_3799 [Firmicutes bacterium]|nr:hypothetical protein [Bacillota bacterium]